MTFTKEEIQKDVKTYKSLSALSDSEGGKQLIKNLRKDIKGDIDTICSLVNDDEMKIRVAIISLKKNIALLQTLTRSRKNLDLALEALEEVDE